MIVCVECLSLLLLYLVVSSSETVAPEDSSPDQ